MARAMGKYESVSKTAPKGLPFLLVPFSFFLIELFAFVFLHVEGMALWPLAFGALWAMLLGGLIRMLPRNAGRIGYGAAYGSMLVYAGGETGYYQLFDEMMWISEFQYASEGSDYLDVLLGYPVTFFVGIFALIVIGVVNLCRFPVWGHFNWHSAAAGIVSLVCALGAFFMPELVFENDRSIKYAGSDYGRAQSAEAAYENMFNTHRLYQVCGLHQTLAKDVYANLIYPMTPDYTRAQEEGIKTVDSYFLEAEEKQTNAMTGLLKDKNVILVLMESMDDWMFGEYTPALNQLMSEGINFTNFYTPPYGGIRTFNTEFCINTGNFLSSGGGYAFDYVTNDFEQSLASILTREGYSAATFHYNDPSFYSRGEFSPAMGYEEYVCYADYVKGDPDAKNKLYDDNLLFDNQALRAEFFNPSEKRFDFVITRSAHLSYKYNEVLSYWGLKKYPDFRGLTGNEETDCAYLKAKLVDDFFARLLEELGAQGELENTVIIGVTDHYTYGYKNLEALLELSGVEESLLMEKTPCFIWSADMEPMEVDKVLNTSDFLPTVLNLLGVDPEYNYIGSDAFDESYEGFVPFSNGSWITGDVAYDASKKKVIYLTEDAEPVTKEFMEQMAQKVNTFTKINNLILDTNYYASEESLIENVE